MQRFFVFAAILFVFVGCNFFAKSKPKGNVTKFGVHWTPGPCSKTGGLEGLALNKKFRKMIGKPECKFGN